MIMQEQLSSLPEGMRRVLNQIVVRAEMILKLFGLDGLPNPT